MTIQEACQVLGVTFSDGERKIKLQFRRLMSKYHPDAAGAENPKYIGRAQQIIEAYSVLKQQNILQSAHGNTESTFQRWDGICNEKAFCERVILMNTSDIYGEVMDVRQVAKGRYLWDPDQEEFLLFLRSVKLASNEILEKLERDNEIYQIDGERNKKERFEWQVRLFHCLMSQFVDPWYCLECLLDPEEIDVQGRRIYYFRGYLGAKSGTKEADCLLKLHQTDSIYPMAFKENRILVQDTEKNFLGHLSLQHDELYYIVIPMLQVHAAQLKMQVNGVEGDGKGRRKSAKVNVDLYLRVENGGEKQKVTGKDLEIANILKKYDDWIHTLA